MSIYLLNLYPSVTLCETALDYDHTTCALLLKKIVPGTPFYLDKDKDELKHFFDIIYQNTTTSINNEIKSYFQLFEEKVKLAQKNDYLWQLRLQYNVRTRKFIKQYFIKDNLYFMHGDLHSGNVLKECSHFCAIDPLGFLAPRDFIFVRFAIFQLIFSKDKAEMVYKILTFLAEYIDKEKFILALFIDTDMAINTGLVQDNDNYKMVSAFIDLMKFLELYFESCY